MNTIETMPPENRLERNDIMRYMRPLVDIHATRDNVHCALGNLNVVMPSMIPEPRERYVQSSR